ncbi:hypothetical protein ILUMI_26781 [Ignelater luminosus]|uniref:Uncharacterized protein n=1 Tax=Ignelater luminosus TaxID=2038154 RepID=A0A8K0C630_IGNLU|nr:hypothetical protein ILUMI_26781 [Ignelater luminosus]
MPSRGRILGDLALSIVEGQHGVFCKNPRIAQRHLWKRNIKKLKVYSELAYIFAGNKPVQIPVEVSPKRSRRRWHFVIETVLKTS